MRPGDAPELSLHLRFEEVLSLVPRTAVLAVDIPIGLPRAGRRACDREARALLGPRRSSVFSAPTRDLLHAKSFEEVRGRGLTLQGFHILSRIREVDALVTAELQAAVREAHPELAFLSLSGHPMRFGKKTAEGREERLAALEAGGPWPAPRQAFARDARRFRRADVALDDILDAYALAVTARRIATGSARRLPAHPEVDERGLRMEIWF